MKFFLLILIACKLNAQNLVPNSSFELHTTCAFTVTEIYTATSWNVPANTENASPDYFNACQFDGLFSVPNNVMGIQPAYEGNAYAGFVAYGTNPLNFREYIQTELISPLITGQQYLVSFYVSPGDNLKYASNNIGAILTVQPVIGNGTSQNINLTPQILNTTIVTDTSGWTLISGTYIAIGDERYITIGNFADNVSTQTVIINPNASSLQQYAYYYIDNVSVAQSQMNTSEFISKKIIVTPNPVAVSFSINFNELGLIKAMELHSQYNLIKLFNINDTIFDVKDLSTGVYYLTIVFDSNERITTKIIKL